MPLALWTSWNAIRKWGLLAAVIAAAELCPLSFAEGGDWPRFRGPNGSGVAADDGVPPDSFSDKENLKWKVELPGAGVSSPIVQGDKVYVTCYSGYGTRGTENGKIEDLKRHLVCVDRNTGSIDWTATVPAEMPEDLYTGAGVPAHGYASHTPVTDGERVYCFFGKSGVVAFDLQGNKVWQTNVGKESGPREWGSAASPLVFEDLVIVNASDESESLVALDKATGTEKWRAQAGGLASTWGTPALLGSGENAELVIAVPGEIWAFGPRSGKLKWFASGLNDESISNSVVVGDNVVYAAGSRGNNAVAITAGGKGDVNETHIAWQSEAQGRFATPILFDNLLFSVSGLVVTCYNAADGKQVYQERIGGGPVPAAQQPPSVPGAGGPGGRRGGGGRNQDYASPVIAAGKMYITTRSGVVHIVAAGAEFKELGKGDLTLDTSGFNGTPAISNGQLFLRSNTYLYCVSGE